MKFEKHLHVVFFLKCLELNKTADVRQKLTAITSNGSNSHLSLPYPHMKTLDVVFGLQGHRGETHSSLENK